jgi:tRNA(Arg) A34 adenosine deaminase TadA
MLNVALEEARIGLNEGGIPIGAAIFTRAGELVSRGHNRRVIPAFMERPTHFAGPAASAVIVTW